MNSPKVSIISPCYNGELYINRFLDSILHQTYNNIELIIVNDGSSDSTEQSILAYREQFEKRGYELKYLFQNNSGQSSAINKGLDVFTGQYLTWLDSDDYLPNYAIEKKVNYLESHPQCGILLCKIQVVCEGSLKPLFIEQRILNKGINDNLFFDLITGNNVFYTPGGYMVRTSMFRQAMPKPLKIEAPREIGQNFQLLLPTVYKFPVGYINDICYYYVIRQGSHSHTKLSYEELEKKTLISNRVLKKITEHLTNDPIEKGKIHKAILYRYLTSKLSNIYISKNKKNLKKIIEDINQNEFYDSRVRNLFLKIKYPQFDFIIRTLNFLTNKTQIFTNRIKSNFK